MKTLTFEQTTELIEKMRSEQAAGRPEVAAQIQKAMDRGEFFLGSPTVEVKVPDAPSRGAKKDAWIEYAKQVSDIDHEVIEDSKRSDIIGMLEANGIIDQLVDEDDEG